MTWSSVPIMSINSSPCVEARDASRLTAIGNYALTLKNLPDLSTYSGAPSVRRAASSPTLHCTMPWDKASNPRMLHIQISFLQGMAIAADSSRCMT